MRVRPIVIAGLAAISIVGLPVLAGQQTRSCVTSSAAPEVFAFPEPAPLGALQTLELLGDDSVAPVLAQLPLLAQARAVPVQANRTITITGRGSFLGVDVCEVDKDRVKALNLKEERGVEITRVADDTPASKAGLKVGDVVLEYQGQRVEGTEQFMRLVRETPPGREVRIGILRGGQPQTLTATVAARKAGGTVFALGGAEPFGEIRIPEMPPMPVMPDMPRTYMSWRSQYLGIEGESLTPQLAEFFGVKEGVLVRAVQKGTAAEKYGIRAGDVITKVDDDSVSSPREITDAIRGLKGKKTFPVVVVRDKREQTISVTLEEEAPAAAPARPVRPARLTQRYRL